MVWICYSGWLVFLDIAFSLLGQGKTSDFASRCRWGGRRTPPSLSSCGPPFPHATPVLPTKHQNGQICGTCFANSSIDISWYIWDMSLLIFYVSACQSTPNNNKNIYYIIIFHIMFLRLWAWKVYMDGSSAGSSLPRHSAHHNTHILLQRPTEDDLRSGDVMLGCYLLAACAMTFLILAWQCFKTWCPFLSKSRVHIITSIFLLTHAWIISGRTTSPSKSQKL